MSTPYDGKERSMKQYYTGFMILIMTMAVSAKEIIAPQDSISVRTVVGTTSTFRGIAVEIDITKLLPTGIEIDSEFRSQHNPLPQIKIQSADESASYLLDIAKGTFSTHAFRLFEQNKEIESLLANKTNYLSMTEPLRIKIGNGDIIIITPEALKNASLSQLEWTTAQQKMLDMSREGYANMYGTKFDAGWRPGQSDSVPLSTYLNFSFFTELIPGIPAQISGILSNKVSDVANRISIAPVIVRPWSSQDIYGLIRYETNQQASERRIAGTVYYQGLIGNFVNLSEGFHRLRLKPFISTGVQVLYYFTAQDSLIVKQPLYEPFANIYYYIPIHERFSLLFEGSIFWRSDKNANFIASNAQYQMDITLGYEIPGAGTKIMTKYSYGVQNVSFQRDDKVIVGLLVDFFDKK
jgi:hypothetical protein